MDKPQYDSETFEKFKAEAIAAINAIKIEDDPHIIVIAGKGHDESRIISCACPGFTLRKGGELVEMGLGLRQPDRVTKGNVPPVPMSKGGEA